MPGVRLSHGGFDELGMRLIKARAKRIWRGGHRHRMGPAWTVVPAQVASRDRPPQFGEDAGWGEGESPRERLLALVM
jgi:hypothetical protein